VAEARGKFGNPEEGELAPLEVVSRGLMKTQLSRLSAAVVNCRVCKIARAVE
jgi:hypothetical protein